MKDHTTKLKSGDIFYIRETKYHVVGIIKDNEVPILVYKFWQFRKKRWTYISEEVWAVNVGFKYGYSLKPIKD